jgi:exodeoxyribonuclease V gamma subunit
LGERHAAPPFLAGPLPAPPVDHDIPLDGLISAVVDPAAALLRQRLAAPALAVEEDDLPEDLAISLKGLPEWGLGDRMLRSMQTGLDVAQTMATERRRGVLPPRQLSNAAVDDVGRQVQDLWDAAFAGRPDGSADVVDLLAELPGDRAVVGSAAVRGDTLVRVEYATLKPKHRLQSWIRLLALTVGRPDRTWSALTVGRAAKDRGSKRSAGVQRSMVGPVPPDVAAQALGRLVAVRDLALRGALPFALTSSHDYVRSRRQPGATIGAALTAAASAWENGRYPERSAAAARLVWGAEAPLEVLLDAGPAVVVPPDWPQDSTWFGVLAQAVWGPLLDAETLS